MADDWNRRMTFTREQLKKASRDRLENPAPMERGPKLPSESPPEFLATSGGLKAPPGKFRAVGVDTFEGPTSDYMIGDFDTREEAINAARKEGGKMNPTYVYDDKGNLLASFGKP